MFRIQIAVFLIVGCGILWTAQASPQSVMREDFEYDVPGLVEYEAMNCSRTELSRRSKEVLGAILGGAGAMTSARLLWVPSELKRQLSRDQVAVQAMEEYLKQVKNLEYLKQRRAELAVEFRRSMKTPEFIALRRRYPTLEETPEKLFSRSDAEIRELLKRFEIQDTSADKISTLLGRMKANRLQLDVVRLAQGRATTELHRLAIIHGRTAAISSEALRARADALYEKLRQNRSKTFRSGINRRVGGAAVAIVTGLGLMFMLDTALEEDASKKPTEVGQDDHSDSEWLRCLAENLIHEGRES